MKTPTFFALVGICLMLCHCAPHTHLPDIDFDPISEAPQLDGELKRGATRGEVELLILQDGRGDTELQRRILETLETKGHFHEPETMSPEQLYRVSSIVEALRIFPDQTFDQDQELKRLFAKHPKASVAFVHPDSIVFVFFDKNNRFKAFKFI